jgi:hypothetical protein
VCVCDCEMVFFCEGTFLLYVSCEGNCRRAIVHVWAMRLWLARVMVSTFFSVVIVAVFLIFNEVCRNLFNDNN